MITESLFFVAYLVLLPIAFMFPFAGALAYEWLQYMPPDSVYNAQSFNSFSLVMGGVALSIWGLRDKKVAPAPMGLLIIFAMYMIWANITQATTIVPNDAGHEWYNRAYKMLIFTFALSFMARTRQRIEAFIWVVCLSIGNFVIMGAIKTILSGGGGTTVIGANGNILGERVSFAIAITTIIPLIRYLRDHSTLIERTRRVRIALDGYTVACILATVGTQARTGVVSLAVLGTFYFFKSKRKLVFILIIPILAALVYLVAPPEYFGRMNTISSHEDSSAMGRIDSWIWGWNFALAHPITGGGFHSFLLHQTGTIDHPAYLEAHNIFFETLADHGFVGLGLFLMLVFGGVFCAGRMAKRARKIPDLDWAANLGSMLQLSILTFLAGSQFISDATQSMVYELCALTLAAGGIVKRRMASEATSPIIRQDAPMTKRPIQAPRAASGRRHPAPAIAYRRSL
jgi:probable O-glycosylation ligase (exosortase A-associated)